MKQLLFLLMLCSGTAANAQTNELPLMGFRFINYSGAIEDANNYYFMTSITNASQIPFVPRGSAYTLHKCNKITHAVERSVFLVGDTLQTDSVILSLIYFTATAAGRICLTYSKRLLMDPAASRWQRYGSALYYQELDTALNVVVPEKQLLVAGPHERFINYWPVTMVATPTKRVVLYQLFDTLYNQQGTLSKYLLLDAQGNVLKHDTVDLKPNISPTQTLFHYASECVVTPTGGFMIGGFNLGSFIDYRGGFVTYDSNMQFIDTFAMLPYQFTPAWPGAYNSFPNMLMLPSGSIITGGPYQGTSTNGNYYHSSAISKSGSADTRYYFAPPVVTPYKDGSDGAHIMQGRYNLVYNTYDNRVYYADMTHSSWSTDGCYGTSNYAEVICADTNLNIMWRKYIFSGNNACNFVGDVIRCYGRAGVLIQGDDRYDDTTKSYSFLYHIDSSSTTGVTNSPITIRDRFAVYPNPAKDHIIVDDFLGKLAEVSITNMQGQVVYHNTASGNKLQISVAQYPAGLYMVRVRSRDNEWYSTKVIKE